MNHDEAAAILTKLALAACPDESTLLICYDAIALVFGTKDLCKSAARCAALARKADAARDSLDAAIETALPGGQFRLPLANK